MIKIRRFIISTGEEKEILINPRYIYKIEPANDGLLRIIMVPLIKEDITFIYTRHAMSTIIGKIKGSKQ